MKNSIIVFSGLLLTSLSLLAQDDFKNVDIDADLRAKLALFQIRPLVSVEKYQNKSLYSLGKRLYSDTLLSGNKNISCQKCHDLQKGTSDGLPLSQTSDGKSVLRRNSPALFNAGHASRNSMFWDGRVRYLSEEKIFFTPEKALNGPMPSEPKITEVLSGALAAQALFPMVSNEEMRGHPGENEIADASSNLEAWSLIVERLKQKKHYRDLFARAFPETQLDQINIGHVAEAIAQFEREEFDSVNTPFNSYLKGNNQALKLREKRGLKVFLTGGRCVACHRGGSLGGEETVFMNIGVPSWGKEDFKVDHGQKELEGNEMAGDFEFKTPSLINVALSAPYTHNGAFETIRDVLNHYGNARASLMEFDVSFERQNQIPVPIRVERNPQILADIFASVPPVIKHNIILGEDDKDDLEAFLTNALTDPKFKKLVK